MCVWHPYHNLPFPILQDRPVKRDPPSVRLDRPHLLRRRHERVATQAGQEAVPCDHNADGTGRVGCRLEALEQRHDQGVVVRARQQRVEAAQQVLPQHVDDVPDQVRDEAGVLVLDD